MRDWLGALSLAEFRSTYLDRAPIARPGAAAAAIPLFGWDTLERILASEPSPDVLVVARGRVVDAAVPRTLAALSRLMDRGLGLVVRRAERCDGQLLELSRTFTADLGGEGHVQLFVTSAGTHGFGWHYDLEHVFIAQTSGIKDYYFRANTVCGRDDRSLDFERFHAERSPMATARLLPGDWLYLPSRWWHTARCAETSLSISLGILLQ
jgi:hypothetical protein